MALNKLDKTSREFSESTHQDEEEFMIILKDLIDKVNTGFDKTNEHINKVASMQTEINTEKNKDGITTAQANAIVANTAKTGISTAQANAITDNTAKTGITTSQADAIAANTKKTGISTEQSNFITALNQGVAQAVGTNIRKVTATVVPMVTIDKKGSTLDLSIRMSDGSVYATSLALTKLK